MHLPAQLLVSFEGVQFRPFAPSDVDGVNPLFKLAYGPSYPYKVSPHVPRGAYYFVAANEAGEIIGFARSRWLQAEDIESCYPDVYELGGYVVHPEYRRRGIGERLSALCEQAASAEGEIHIAHSEPVCWGNGLASQKIFDKHGFRVLGIALTKYPDISPQWHGSQPASMTLVARRTLGDGRFVQRPRFLPPEYEAFVQTLLADCPMDKQAYVSRMPHVVRHSPVIASGLTGCDIVDVPANWPESQMAIDFLRSSGYIFSGYLVEHGCVRGQRFDYLRLVRPPATHREGCDWGLIQVIPSAQPVKDFVMHEYQQRYGC